MFTLAASQSEAKTSTCLPASMVSTTPIASFTFYLQLVAMLGSDAEAYYLPLQKILTAWNAATSTSPLSIRSQQVFKNWQHQAFLMFYAAFMLFEIYRCVGSWFF
ncbi:hypothetical protein [Phyllobacterium sp. SB3]|uniref:hypothetical protein n=1 Tax=Phyllobacterium sp. SB3 TaxID=3156073 RepID=UPI0032AE9050